MVISVLRNLWFDRRVARIVVVCSWSYGSWIYNYLCNQCLSPLMLWVRTPFMVRCTLYIQHYVIKFVS